MSIKKQLSAYYDKQGLTGKHRRKAMQWDMRQVRKEKARKFSLYGTTPYSIFGLYWGSMPNPTLYYWAKRDLCMGS